MKVSTSLFAALALAIFSTEVSAIGNPCAPTAVCMDQVWDMSKISFYYTPSIFAAQLLLITLALLFGMGVCCMMDLEVNPVIADKSINWGKVEEAE